MTTAAEARVAEQTVPYFANLYRHEYANLITFRKNGQPVVTPVWFAERNGKIYVMTTASAGKVKRIRNNPQVEIGPSDRAGKPLGPTVPARARILPPDEARIARDALDDKYGLMKAMFDFFMNIRGVERAWIEIAPLVDTVVE
ncbi:MAG TPA: PPOX class F420-dependent oxidoreductase [Chloroflexus aurantiacus]|uniref:Pyridoxamine 5'-phosphate oxidase-related FMN-binding n=1 Tax=Chloroflexus aurantiacus (strain ATCC 29366 / DSM 635 / J-10-fl) TaxID=324602 RepID=A9WH35_CHLAA|nr:pyridoxamine 5'-phosphate oxidase-related FMN-binding [Chloroflexus aurantiacus J-10-fl]RMG53723.1 MAG: PPOX class F420-dependent oxidoreductase [Chloroflexota bacterium]HBW67153.1 PPOX class F420-dependent oxidoreductase [Chloroflexus aurantiacus]